MIKKLFGVVVIVLATIGVLAIFGKLDINKENTENQMVEETKLHAELVYSSGDIYKKTDNTWQKIELGEILEEKDHIKTNTDSLATLSFDDGSIIRLSGNSEIILDSINKEKIDIEDVSGNIYNRVAKIDNREFTVSHEDIKVTALGTAFFVKADTSEMSVDVIESKVKLTCYDKEEMIEEGTATKINKQTKEIDSEKIDVENYTKDEFVKWNDEEDVKKGLESNFTKKEEIEKNEEIEKTEQETDEKTEEVADITPTWFLSLSVNNTQATWKINGTSPNGFKLVWSKNSAPTYPTRSGDKYIYYSNPETRSGTLSAFDGTGTYYVRVCEYLGGKCGRYSNQVPVYLTAVEKKTEPEKTTETSNNVKSISLSAEDDYATWVVDGNSPKGFKIVWSKNINPTYPTRSGDKYIYYSNPDTRSGTLNAFDGTGTYYVRICEYLGGACGVYSNQLTVELEK